MKTKHGLSIRYGLQHTGYRLLGGNPRRVAAGQRGAILPLVALGMGALLAMAGLALDMGHGYLNKTRLQNALDAAALSGAKTLNELGNTAAAETAALTVARTTFQNNANSAGNAELQSVADASINVQFSPTVDPFTPGGANPRRFIRVSVAAANFSWPTWLIHVLGPGFATGNVSGSAVAGPMSVCPRNMLPMVACAGKVDPDNPESDLLPSPHFGYVPGTSYTLKIPANNTTSTVGAGNFQLLSLDCGTGANCVRDALAGANNNPLCSGPTDAVTQPGNLAGPVKQGLNSRLDCPGGCGPLDTSMYPPDINVNTGISKATYDAQVTPPFTPHPGGVPGRRILPVPFADCTAIAQGRSEVTILGVGCFFMTDKVQQGGNDNAVNSEYISACPASGGSLRNSVGLTGPWTIILYKDFTPGVADS